VGEALPGPGNVSAPTAASERAHLALTTVCPAGARRSRDQDRGCEHGVGQSNRRRVGEALPGPGNVSAPTAASERARLALTAVCPAGARRLRDQDRGCAKGVGQSNRQGVGEGARGPGNVSAPAAASERARLALTTVRTAGTRHSRDQDRGVGQSNCRGVACHVHWRGTCNQERGIRYYGQESVYINL